MNNKYKSFSERSGFKQPKPTQLESMDNDLRNALWNVFHNKFSISHQPFTHELHRSIWSDFLHKPVDEFHFLSSNPQIKNFFKVKDWNLVFDFIEFCFQSMGDIEYWDNFSKECNKVLERENSCYRIIKGYVVPITSEEEIATIEEAMNVPYEGAASCIRRAVISFSDRENPDYHNSIKDSICAVEAMAKEVTGKNKGTLGAMANGLNLHPAFCEGLIKIYGFTSDADIRHGGTGKSLYADSDTARFMLVMCSAFVNFIIAKNQNNLS